MLSKRLFYTLKCSLVSLIVINSMSNIQSVFCSDCEHTLPLSNNFNNSYQSYGPFSQGELAAQIRDPHDYDLRIAYDCNHYELMVSSLVSISSNQIKDLLTQKNYKHWKCSIKYTHSYDLLSLLATIEGYNIISFVIYQALVSDPANYLKAASILIEAINIELYFYSKTPSCTSLMGKKVYRALTISKKAYFAFSDQNFNVISAPLSLWLAFTIKTFALSLLKPDAALEEDEVNVMLEIDVLNLNYGDLKSFYEKHPTSVVSSTCAVSIASIAGEGKVLLRDANLRVTEISDAKLDSYSVKLIKCYMVNANLHHINNIQGLQTQVIQEDFQKMVKKVGEEHLEPMKMGSTASSQFEQSIERNPNRRPQASSKIIPSQVKPINPALMKREMQRKHCSQVQVLTDREQIRRQLLKMTWSLQHDSKANHCQ